MLDSTELAHQLSEDLFQCVHQPARSYEQVAILNLIDFGFELIELNKMEVGF